MDENFQAILTLALTKPLRSFVQPMYMRAIVEIAEQKNMDNAEKLCDLANAIERIGLLRDRVAWVLFMQADVNPDYRPNDYIKI